MIGDSTMQQTSATIMALLQSAAPRALCSSQIRFIREDFFHNNAFLRHMRHKPDIVIINAGAHFTVKEKYESAMLKLYQNIESWRMSERALHNSIINSINNSSSSSSSSSGGNSGGNSGAGGSTLPGGKTGPRPLESTKILWKTNNPGHINCDAYPDAVSSPLTYPIETDTYKWGLLSEFDAYMRELNIKHNIPAIDMFPLYLRPDAHPGKNAVHWVQFGGDCLHYCLPGPLDIFATLLLHYLED